MAAQFAPVYDRLAISGGELAVGLVRDDSNRPFARLFVPAPPEAPPARPQPKNVFEGRGAATQHARADSPRERRRRDRRGSPRSCSVVKKCTLRQEHVRAPESRPDVRRRRVGRLEENRLDHAREDRLARRNVTPPYAGVIVRTAPAPPPPVCVPPRSSIPLSREPETATAASRPPSSLISGAWWS
jgi:hypothetical protein